MAENSVDIKKMSVEELKALAYDQMVVLESTKNNLNVLSAEISSRKGIEVEKEVIEEK